MHETPAETATEKRRGRPGLSSFFAESVRKRPAGFPYETLVAIVIVVVGALIVGWWSRNMWFFADIWDHLTMREAGDVGDLLRPHRGHWQTPAVLQTRFLHWVFGMDYWPWYQLPRAIFWGGFSLLAWWDMRRRGASPSLALGALAVLTFPGSSAYFQSAHIGTPIALSCLIGVAFLIETRPRPSNWDLLGMFGLMVLGLASSALGISILVMAGLMTLAFGRFRRWLAPMVAAGLVYVAWALGTEVTGASYASPKRGLVALPEAVLVSVRNVLADVTGTPEIVGWLLLVGFAAGFGWLLWKRLLTPFDIGAVGAAAFYLAGIALVRDSLERDNVIMNMLPLLLLVLIPRLVFRRRWAVVVATSLIGVIALMNAVSLESGLARRTRNQIGHSRPVVERMATLIAEGQPYLRTLRTTDLTSSSQMSLGGFAKLVDDGWHPERSEARNASEEGRQQRIEDEALIRLKLSRHGTSLGGDRPIVQGRPVSKGCAVAPVGESVALAVHGSVEVRVTVDADRPRTVSLVVAWSDGTRRAETEFVIKKKKFGKTSTYYIYGAEPGGATFEFGAGPNASSVQVCGVVGE